MANDMFVREVAKCSLYKEESTDAIGALEVLNYLIRKARQLGNFQ